MTDHDDNLSPCFVVFCDADNKVASALLPSSFQHVSVALLDTDGTIDMWHPTFLKCGYTNYPELDVEDFLDSAFDLPGGHVLFGFVEEPRPIKPHPTTCVTFAKHFFSVNDPLVVTPKQLYNSLLSKGFTPCPPRVKLPMYI